MVGMDKLEINELNGEQREIAECIGIDSYKKLVENFGGTLVYVQKADTLCINARNREITKMFDGNNYRELTRKFNLSEAQIRRILSETYF